MILSGSCKSQIAHRVLVSSWKPTILIAEDSADSREMMEVLLENRGYEVVSAENGVRALEVAIRSRPNALLLDLELPQLDGLSVTRNLRLHPGFAQVPIIIVSGHDPNRYRQAALDAGCNEYLLKPINFKRLQELLDQFVPREQRAALKSA
jgi:two-component system cell cycle response regulator DivK